MPAPAKPNRMRTSEPSGATASAVRGRTFVSNTVRVSFPSDLGCKPAPERGQLWGMTPARIVVVSGAPGTGRSTLAGIIADRLQLPLLSVDVIKEALGDALGLGDESWSDRVGDAAADFVFRLAASFPSAFAEGWWRRERRTRAEREFR